jgi:site-specific DNA-methyltransferase (adenine-specific)
MNRLYFGDNLAWLHDRREFPDASVDLVYLDPPFNSNADYNVLFREPSGQVSQAQFHAFTDTWSWADAADTYHAFIDTCPNVAVAELMEALHSFLKHSPMMAYLAMMAPRLVELHRILKDTGSLYLHCDPTASHYLRMLLDEIFGAANFRRRNLLRRQTNSERRKISPEATAVAKLELKRTSRASRETCSIPEIIGPATRAWARREDSAASWRSRRPR